MEAFQLKMCREALHCTPLEMAALFQCTPGAWYNYERGDRPVPQNVAVAMRAYLQTMVESLLTRQEAARNGPSALRKVRKYASLEHYRTARREPEAALMEWKIREVVDFHLWQEGLVSYATETA